MIHTRATLNEQYRIPNHSTHTRGRRICLSRKSPMGDLKQEACRKHPPVLVAVRALGVG